MEKYPLQFPKKKKKTAVILSKINKISENF